MTDQKRQGEDDGVVTSAPAAKVGNLLGDMIASAKQELADKAKSRESASERRAREEREAREREAAIRRAQAQDALNEAARLRNEQIALAEKARVEAEPRSATSSKTAQHIRPVETAVAPPSASTPRVVEKPASRLLLAALVLIGVGVGLGSAFAFMPSAPPSEVDVGGAARALVAATSKAAASTEQRVLELAGKELAELKRQYGEVQAEQKRLATELAAARQELEIARQAIDAKDKAGQEGKPVRRTNGGGGTGAPTLKPGIF